MLLLDASVATMKTVMHSFCGVHSSLHLLAAKNKIEKIIARSSRKAARVVGVRMWGREKGSCRRK